ncbi:MAG: glycosyltransferase family 4 protein [Planctomycetota bacterium]
MTRFLFVNQHYAPDVASTGQHLADLAEWLVARGHRVAVITSSAGYEGGRVAAPRRERRNGVDVLRVRATALGRGGTLARLVDYASFHLLAGARTLAGARRADVVVTLTTPPLLGVWGEFARRIGRVRHVAFLMDLHPDAEIALGMLDAESWVGRALRAAQRWIVANADAGVVLGRHMAQRLVDDGVPRERLETIPIWSAGVNVEDANGVAELRAERGWSERFVAMYSGNAGHVHRFDEFLAAAERLEREAPHVLFAFVGGGPRRPELERRARGRRNIEFRPYVPRAELARSLAAADVHLVSLEAAAAGVSIPGKLIGILAAGRPVVFVGPRASEPFESVEASGAGFALEPGGDVARALVALARDPDECRRMGALGRAWFERHHSEERACADWTRLLERVASGAAREVLA